LSNPGSGIPVPGWKMSDPRFWMLDKKFTVEQTFLLRLVRRESMLQEKPPAQQVTLLTMRIIHFFFLLGSFWPPGSGSVKYGS
jgi:hypothetical protein